MALAEAIDVSAPEERVAVLMGMINAATSELVSVIAEVLRSGAWEGWGIRSPEHWVTWRCGVSPSRARKLVTMARRLADLPMVASTFAAGSLTEDQTHEVCRHATTAHDATVAQLAPGLTVPQLRRVLPSLPQPADSADDVDGGPDGDESEERRQVSFGWRDDGRWWLHAVLPPDEGAMVQKALEAARTIEFHTRHPEIDTDDQHTVATARDRVSWSDALLRLARSALDGFDGATESGRPPGERFQLIVHVDADATTPPRLHLGPLLPRRLFDYLACDITLRAVVERDGRPVRFGRRRRTIPPILRTLIEHRDGGCRVPGCGQRRWLHVHHIVHWANGGSTDPSNLVAFCPHHHRLLHAGRLKIDGDPDDPDPDGVTVADERGRPLTPARARPPDRSASDAAHQLGIPTPPYQNPSGEQLTAWGVIWN